MATDLSLLDPEFESSLFRAPLFRASAFGHPLFRAAPRPAQPLGLDDEQTRSVLASLISAGASGLGAVANTLDTPGGAVRAMLVGRSPLAGALRWDSESRPTGRDVLRHWGLIGPEDTWTNWLGGLALEIATDPLTYLTFGLSGAATAGGKLLGRLGLLGRVPQVAARKASTLLEQRLAPLLAKGLTREQALQELRRGSQAVRELGSVALRTGGEIPGSRWARMNTTVGEVLDDAIAQLKQVDITAAKRLADQAAAFAQQSGTTLDALRRLPVAGQVGIGLPFGPSRSLGRWGSPVATRLADWLDRVGYGLRWGEVPNVLSPTGLWRRMTAGTPLPSTGFSPGRALYAALSPAAKGIHSREGQIAAQGVREAENLYRTMALGRGYEAVRDAQRLIDEGAFTPQELSEALRVRLEQRQGQPLGNIASAVEQKLQGLNPQSRQLFESLVQKMGGGVFVHHQLHKRLGLFSPDLMDEAIDYFPRFLAEGRVGRSAVPRILDTTWESVRRRRDLLRNIPEGTAALNRMAMDPDLVGAQRLPLDQAAARLATQYGVANADQAKGLAAFLGNLPEDALSRGLYGSPTRDYIQYLAHGSERLAAGQGALEFLARHLGRAPRLGEPLVTASELLERLGFRTSAGDVAPEALDFLANRLGLTPDAVRDLTLPKRLADDATRILRPFTQPTAIGPLAGLADAYSALWKTSVTSLWPGFHARNWLSGTIQNILHGVYSPQTHRAVQRLLTEGKPIPGSAKWPAVRQELIARGLPQTDEAALDVLKEMAFRNEVIGRYHGMQHVGPGMDLPEEFAHAIPGAMPWRFGERIRAALGRARSPEAWNPLNIRGVGGRMESGNWLARLGEDIGWRVESENRLVPFFEMLKRGYGDLAAAQRVRDLQVDYTMRAFSGLENAILKRLFPFYGFHSRMAKHLASELYRAPGGGLAQAIRATHRLQDKNTVLPDYLSQGVAIPLGVNPQGGPRILGGLSLMHEPAAALVGPAASALLYALGGEGREAGLAARQALQELSSQIHPGLKAPLEWATGRSFFQRGPEGGRELVEQDPVVGRLLANLTGAPEPIRVVPGWLEHLLVNSPLSRLLTTARQVSDPRKWTPYGLPLLANIGLGMRVTDISPQAQEAIVREAAQTRLMQTGLAKTFEQTYIPPAILAQLDPSVWGEAIALNELLHTLARRASARAKGKPVPPLARGD